MIKAEPADCPVDQVTDSPKPPEGIPDQPDPVVEAPVGDAAEPNRLDHRSTWCNWTVLTMLVLLIFVITYFRPTGRSGASQGPGIGQPLSRLELQPLVDTAETVTLANLTGRVVLLNFWEPKSSQSALQLPQLAAIERQFADQPAFRLLSVSCGRVSDKDQTALRDATRESLRRENVELRIYADLSGASRAAVKQVIGLSRYPTTLVLDRLGRVRRVWAGFRAGDEVEMQQLITQLLAEG